MKYRVVCQSETGEALWIQTGVASEKGNWTIDIDSIDRGLPPHAPRISRIYIEWKPDNAG